MLWFIMLLSWFEKRLNKYVPAGWDFLSLEAAGCWLKKVQAFLNGDVMVFFQEAILIN